jgi:hypothetical protein
MNLAGIAHILLYVFQVIYPYIISNPKLDYIYVLSIVAMYLSWTIFNGQCLATIIYLSKNPQDKPKKKEYNSEFKEIYIKLFKSEKVGFLFFSVLNIINILNVLIVLNRLSFAKSFLSIVGLCMLVYLYFSYKQIQWINALFFFVFSVLLFLMFKKWKKMK